MGEKERDQQEMNDISLNCPKGAFPWILFFKCPVGVTIYDNEDNILAHESEEELGGMGLFSLEEEEGENYSDVISWITEEGGKAFFIPHYSDADYIEIVTHSVIEEGDDTMLFSAAALDGASDEPYEDKTFEDVALSPGKTFRVFLTEDDERIDIDEIELYIWENDAVVGRVLKNGDEVFICGGCGLYEDECACVRDPYELEVELLYYAMFTAGIPGSQISTLAAGILDADIIGLGCALELDEPADDLINAMLAILYEEDDFEALFTGELGPWAEFVDDLIVDLGEYFVEELELDAEDAEDAAMCTAAIETILAFYSYLICDETEEALSLVAQERAYEVLLLFRALGALLGGEAFETLEIENDNAIFEFYGDDFTALFAGMLPFVLDLELPNIDNWWALYDGWGYTEQQAEAGIQSMLALLCAMPFEAAAMLSLGDAETALQKYQLGPQPPAGGCLSVDLNDFTVADAHFAPLVEAIREELAALLDLDFEDAEELEQCVMLAAAFLYVYFADYLKQINIWRANRGELPLEIPNFVMSQMLGQIELYSDFMGQYTGIRSNDPQGQMSAFLSQFEGNAQSNFFATIFASISSFVSSLLA